LCVFELNRFEFDNEFDTIVTELPSVNSSTGIEVAGSSGTCDELGMLKQLVTELILIMCC